MFKKVFKRFKFSLKNKLDIYSMNRTYSSSFFFPFIHPLVKVYFKIKMKKENSH